MTSPRGLLEFWRNELPHAPAARWASLFFSLHVLTLLISLAASEAFLAAATVAYAVHLLRLRPAISFPPVKLPLLLFCLATVNSMLWSRDAALGGFVLRKLVLFLILLLSVNLVVSARHLGALFRLLFIEAGLAGFVGIAQFVIQYERVRSFRQNVVYIYMTVTRIHGFMGHWMNFGGQQMLVFAALLAFVLLLDGVIPSTARNLALLRGGSRREVQSNIPGGVYPERTAEILRCAQDDSERARNDTLQDGKAQGLYWLVLAVVSISLVLNFTRGAWLGCMVATLYILARRKPRMLWAVPIVLVVFGLAAPSLIRRRLLLAFHPRQDPALAIRLEMWEGGLRMVREHPWVGVGPGNVPMLYTKYLPPGTIPIVGYHEHLHDNFLQLAAERGLPCLVAWLWFMLALGWHILRIRRRLTSRRWVADAAFAAWLAFVAEGFFEFNFGTSPVLMVFLFLMSTPFIAENLESRAKEPSSPQRSQSSRSNAEAGFLRGLRVLCGGPFLRRAGS